LILKLKKAEKGSTGKSIMETLSLVEPEELMYKEHHIRALFSNLDTDYYDRYEFSDMQKVILNDRRIRINYWAAKILKKPVEKFTNPIFLNKLENAKYNDIKNPYYATKDKLPLTIRMKGTEEKKPDDYNRLIFDQTKKLQQNQLDECIKKAIEVKSHVVGEFKDLNNYSTAINTLLLRPYNEGRHGKWNNYACVTIQGAKKTKK